MNKLEIIDHIAKSADISKAAAGRSLDAAVSAIKTAMKKGGMVTLVGFGTFYVGKRAARAGQLPLDFLGAPPDRRADLEHTRRPRRERQHAQDHADFGVDERQIVTLARPRDLGQHRVALRVERGEVLLDGLRNDLPHNV